MNLARRTLTSSAYNISANFIQVAINFARSVALARLLAPEVFGVYTFVSAIISLTQTIPNFGLTGAFLAHSQHERASALRVHFTLTMLFNAIWALVLAVGAAALAPAETRWAFWIITAAVLVSQLTQTPRAALTQVVTFRRLALMETLVVIIDSAVAVGLAWYGYGLWSLLAANLVGSLVAVSVLYGVRPVWRPGFQWSPPIVRDFLHFGSQVLSGNLLLQALDRIDDIWTKASLGDQALGFYDRAYGFATYPRRIISKPINEVAMGTYALLKEDRKRLSQAFFRMNALLIRTNFLFAGWLALIAPEFIRIVLGARWMPMLTAFRLMLIYTLLDPIKLTVSNVITTSGAPEKVTKIRILQLVVMVVGLWALTPRLGIVGVALAVDLMLVVGFALLFYQVRTFVDFSLPKMFLPPSLALGASLLAARLAIMIPGVLGSDWRTGILKTVVFTSLYSIILFSLERQKVLMTISLLRQMLSGNKNALTTEE